MIDFDAFLRQLKRDGFELWELGSPPLERFPRAIVVAAAGSKAGRKQGYTDDLAFVFVPIEGKREVQVVAMKVKGGANLKHLVVAPEFDRREIKRDKSMTFQEAAKFLREDLKRGFKPFSRLQNYVFLKRYEKELLAACPKL